MERSTESARMFSDPMRDSLIARLRQQGIEDERALDAIRRLPRERFVPDQDCSSAWENVALPIGSGQTISQPYIVALMTQALHLTGNERVLEIGTGSGYQTAILAELAAEVVTVERIASLAAAAVRLLQDLSFQNVTSIVADGTHGWAPGAPYDRIVVTAAGPVVPKPLLRQLDPQAGRLVMPVGNADEQELVLFTYIDEILRSTKLGPVRFVPLIGNER